MSHLQIFAIEPSARTKARLACWRMHRLKVSWRLALTKQEWVDDPYADVHAALREQRESEVALGRRSGIPPSVWFNRRLNRFTRGFRSSPPPAASNPAGTSSQP